MAKIKAEYDKPAAEVDDKTIHDHLVKVAPAGQGRRPGRRTSPRARSSPRSFSRRRYLNAYVAHSALETHTALVKLDGDKATVWSSTQSPFGTKDERRPGAQVPARERPLSSRRSSAADSAARPEARRPSRLPGWPRSPASPSRWLWSREDEFFNDTFRPAAVVNIKSGVSDAGRITFWDYEVIYAGERSSQQFYDIPHHRTVVRGEWGGGRGGAASGHPFGVGAWRAPGATRTRSPGKSTSTSWRRERASTRSNSG